MFGYEQYIGHVVDGTWWCLEVNGEGKGEKKGQK